VRDHRFPHRMLLGVALAGAVFAGCGGSDDDGSSGAAGAGDATTPAEASTAPGTVAMKDIKFIPARLTVKVGEKVTWRNDDPLDHNVIAQEGADFKSRAFGQGGTYTFTPKTAGTIKYVCTLHPGMDGELVVSG
jgi:plastocyanin